MEAIDLRSELSKHHKNQCPVGAESYLDRLRRLERELGSLSVRGVPYWPYMTLHDLAHSHRVIKNLEHLLVPIYALQDTRYRLNTTEVFVLLAAAIVHDVGMFVPLSQSDVSMIRGLTYEPRPSLSRFEGIADAIEVGNIEALEANAHVLGHYLRSAHQYRSSEYIRLHRRDLELDAEADVVARVAEGHRNADLNSGLFQTVRLGLHSVRRDLLAALLRVADEMDVYSCRVPNALLVINSSSVDPRTRQHWYRHYSVVGCGIETTSKNSLMLSVYVRQHRSADVHYVNERVRRLVTDPIQEVLGVVDNILRLNHIVVEGPVRGITIDVADQCITSEDVQPTILREVFSEVEFTVRCAALAAWTTRADATVRILQEADRLVCLMDKDEHLGTKEYCVYDCGFCYRINASNVRSGNAFEFFCPCYSRSLSDGLQVVGRDSAGRWICPGHVPHGKDNGDCLACNQRARCEQTSRSCLCNECGFRRGRKEGWQLSIR